MQLQAIQANACVKEQTPPLEAAYALATGFTHQVTGRADVDNLTAVLDWGSRDCTDGALMSGSDERDVGLYG